MPELYLAQPVAYNSSYGVYWGPPNYTEAWVELTPSRLNMPGWGLMALSQQATVGYYLGDNLKAVMDSTRKAEVKAALGLGEGIVADDVLGMVIELFTRYADPTGQTRWKPIMPSVRGRRTRMELHLGSQVWDEEFDQVKHPQVLNVWREDYRQLRDECLATQAELARVGATWEQVVALRQYVWAEVKAGRKPVLSLWERSLLPLLYLMPPYHYRKVLDAARIKFKTPWELLSDGITSDPPGPMDTTLNEDWGCGDSDNLDCDLNWTETDGDFDIESNKCAQVSSGGLDDARVEDVLSSDDHYAQADLNDYSAIDAFAAVATRFKSDTRTYYMGHWYVGSNQDRIIKVTTGSESSLGTAGASGIAAHTSKLESNGSTHTYYRDTVQKVQVTNGDITGNVRSGISGYNASKVNTWDAYVAADLAAGWTGIVEGVTNPGKVDDVAAANIGEVIGVA